VQVVEVLHSDVHQEVVIPRDDEHADHLGQPGREFLEAVDGRTGGRT
jgi:hypothetical protein